MTDWKDWCLHGDYYIWETDTHIYYVCKHCGKIEGVLKNENIL